MGKTVVILGAALAGLPLAHYLLKHTTSKIEGLKVILVSPNSDFFWNLATPRAILPDLMPDSKIFFPIAEQFSKYPSDQFEFIVAKAEAVDPATNTVTVSTGRRIAYDTLVIATGTAARENMPFKNLGSTEETKASLQSWRQRIAAASSIVVAGAGTTGVELAGELGEEYAKMGSKQVTIIADKELPLYGDLNQDVRETALKELQNLKVRVITSTKVTDIREAGPNGKKTLELTNSATGKKDTLVADVFIPTYGVSPNTDFLPRDMVDARGFVKQNTYLRVEGHDNIFAIGDVGNLQAPQAKNADDQVNHLAKSLESYLAGGQLLEYKPDNRIMLGVSIGKNRATGQLINWRPWSIIMWYVKGRYMGTDYAANLAAGERTMKNKNW